MKKSDQELLGSGQWYFVNVKQAEEMEKIVINELEYKTLVDGLNQEGKFIKIGDNHYFWSKIDSFGPLKFDEGVLEKIRGLIPEVQEFIKKRIRAGVDLRTLDKLRSEISFYFSQNL